MEIEQWEMVNGECKRRKHTNMCNREVGGGGGGGRESGKWQEEGEEETQQEKVVTKGVKIVYNRTQWGVHGLWTQTSGGNMPNV